MTVTLTAQEQRLLPRIQRWIEEHREALIADLGLTPSGAVTP